MSQQDQQNDEVVESGSPADVIFLLKKLQEQLTFWNAKLIFWLINPRKNRLLIRRGLFSKPSFRSGPSSYGAARHGNRPDSRAERSGPPRERSYESGHRAPSGERSYRDRDSRGSRGFAGKKKPFFSKSRER
ncbi:MAG: hypothetical protein H6753_01535 [Candidatus Omnitrophica bacterium]|nr:hypothetical protein [Candidatus Omnitrophota bacterium]